MSLVKEERTHAARAHRRGRLKTRDVLCLFAVAVVVVIVSLPRLRDFAVRENERDAIHFARELSTLAEEHVRDGEPAMPVSIESVIEASGRTDLLQDAEVSSGGRLVRRRGYLFDLFRSAEGGWVVRAWPWEHGTTGLGAFVALSDGSTFGHANPERDWSGPEHPPRMAELVPLAGLPDRWPAWRRMR